MRRALWLSLALCACAAQPNGVEGSDAAAWLGELAEAHVTADHAESPDQRRRALERARALTPPGSLSYEDQRRVLQDLQFRLALLALEAGDPGSAAAESRRGLALGEADDVYTANLWISAGRAQAALGSAQAAAESYGKALAIHEHLLDRALQGSP